MSRSSESRKVGQKQSEDPNVIQLGFNISVAGKSASDFEIYVNDKKQACGQLSAPDLQQLTSSADLPEDQIGSYSGSTGEKLTGRSCSDKPSEPENELSYSQKIGKNVASGEAETRKTDKNEELTIIDEIQNAMGNFERFSEHLREIPRLSTKRVCTSTPYHDKSNSRSEGNLSIYGHASRPYIPKHDFRDRKYFRKPKTLSSDLFLKPLPAEDYFKRGFIRRYYDVESYRRYSSVDSLPRYYECDEEHKPIRRSIAKSDSDRLDIPSSSSDVCVSESKALGCSKKGDASENSEKQSTSSESTKDIKIYQSGGIIIMQNFGENSDVIEKKDFLDSSKLIETCNNLKEKVENSLHSSDDSQKILLNSSSDEVKGPSGKFVQFDLSSCENTRSKSCDSSSEILKNDCTHAINIDPSNLNPESSKIKENALSISQNHEFTSLSTQENDSIISNLLGMSPTSSTSGKKLEWDSGADVGYLNVDLSKENISTIERIILKALNESGIPKQQVAYQKTGDNSGVQTEKFILQRIPSELEAHVSGHRGDLPSKKSSSGGSSITDINKKSDASDQSNKMSDCVEKIRYGSRRGSGSGVSREKFEVTLKERNNRAKYHNSDSTSPANKKAKQPKSIKYPEKTKKQKEIVSSNAASVSAEEKPLQSHRLQKDLVPSSDKCTYVNTLFCDRFFEIPLDNISRSEESGLSESSDKCRSHVEKSPRVKKLKKKRSSAQGNNLTARLQDKIDTIIDIARYSKRPDEKNEPLSNDGIIITSEVRNELNQSSEEFPCDQIHQEVQDLSSEKRLSQSESTSCLTMGKSAVRNSNEKVARSRPISASSSSIHTVLPSVDSTKGTENVEPFSGVKNFSDQIIQTSERMYESKGIQAFQSGKGSTASSQVEDGSSKNVGLTDADINRLEFIKDSDNIKLNLFCSKSVQAAPGMNFSLPKHLAHPKQVDLLEQVNTKSTQFFGGSNTSLPNYHCNVIVEAAEQIKILKNKTNSDAESNRIKRENKKNSSKESHETEVRVENMDNLENKSTSKSVDSHHYGNARMKKDSKGTKKIKNDPEDKENVSVDEEGYTNVSKRGSNHTQESKDDYFVKNGSKKSDSIVFGSCDVQLSDDGTNVFLTCDVLKEHGDSIDRKIIQEKYFQSQFLELERQKMISRSTSMEKRKELDRNTQTNSSLNMGVSVSCQCSPNFIRKTGDNMVHRELAAGERTRMKESRKTGQMEKNTSQCKSKSKTTEKKRKFLTPESSVSDQDLVLAESLSSISQTALSWERQMQQNSQNQNCAVGRAFSFEYLPGHIYENTKNSQEKSLSDSECNLNLGDSVQSSNSESTTQSGNQLKESESGHTLVLENSDRSSLNSNRIKSLDNNLTELEIVVSRLHEKEAIFQKITDSMLSTVVKASGSGDSVNPTGGGGGGEIKSNHNSQETEEICCELEVLEESSKSNSLKPESLKKSLTTNEVSTACQTDGLVPNSDHFYDEKKKLERRMNNEKEQQIKWIENEINHLNMLRSLLEKQHVRNSSQRRKRHHYLTEANEALSASCTLKDGILQKVVGDSLPKTISALDDIMVEDHSKSKTVVPVKSVEDAAIVTVKDLENVPGALTRCSHLGMAMTLCRANKVQQVTMLPVGVQVTLRDTNLSSEGRTSSLGRKSASSTPLESSANRKEAPATVSLEFVRPSTSGTQHSNKSNKVNDGSSNLTVTSLEDSKSRCKCVKCHKSKCICLKSSDSISKQKSRRNSQQSGKDELDSNKTAVVSSTNVSEEFSKNFHIPAIGDINSQGMSTTMETSPEITRSRSVSKENQSHSSSESSNKFEKCVCGCHVEPLPRCDSCNLLRTCKKCACYRRIQCCACKTSAFMGLPQKKYTTISSSCLCKSDPCHMCRCSYQRNQVCSLCPCHMKKSIRGTGSCKCKKKYRERSCQTEEKECKCCECNHRVKDESDLYRETKHMTEKQHVTEIRKPSEVTYPSEQRFETEVKRSIEEKFPFQMKVPIENKNPAEMKDSVQLKNEIERCPCESQSVQLKELKGQAQCCCKNRNARGNAEDHPRRYFLQVEETAEDDSSESCDNRNSLEVITIKVPIRKVRKVGRTPNLSPQRNARKSVPDKEGGDIYPGRFKCGGQELDKESEFTCCEDCIINSRKHSELSDRPRTADDNNYSPQRARYGGREKYIHCSVQEPNPCKCCKGCRGHQNNVVNEEQGPQFTLLERRDEFEGRNVNVPYVKSNDSVVNGEVYNFSSNRMGQHPHNHRSRLSPNDYRYQEKENEYSGECHCCKDCPGRIGEVLREEEPSDYPSEGAEFLSVVERERIHGSVSRDMSGIIEKGGCTREKAKTSKFKKDGSPKLLRKNLCSQKSGQAHSSPKNKNVKAVTQEKSRDRYKTSDYYNFNKKEYMTKSELEREEKKLPDTRLTLQECLTVKRPDVYTRAECRRKIISEKARDRAERHNQRMDCLTKLLPQCYIPGNNADIKLFTSAQMRKQTKKFYKKLPEVTNKLAEEKKKMQFRTNKLMAEIFAKKLQLQTLKGCLNLSNSYTVMSTM